MALRGNLFVLALALTTVAATVDDYNRNEIEVIRHEVKLCLRDMPAITDQGSWPEEIDEVCADKVWSAYSSRRSMHLQELAPKVVSCVQGYKEVTQQQASDAKQCLVKAVAKDYHGMQREYSPGQKKEILGRVEKCLSQVPIKEAQTLCLKEAAHKLERTSNPGLLWKEDLVDSVTYRCVYGRYFPVTNDQLKVLYQCLSVEMAKDLTAK